MNLFYSIFYLNIYYTSFSIKINISEKSLENIFKQLFNVEQYDKNVRPFGKDGITHVETELKLLQIDLDEKYQQLISTVWIEMTWTDDRLKWNPDEYNGLKEITLNVNRIWYPDIVLQNGVGKNQYITEFKLFNPWITSNGLVTWVPEVKLHTKCLIKVKDFPFDSQCCEINFYSWAHTSSQMKIQQYGDKNVTNLTHLAYNTEWLISNTCAINKTINTGVDLEWWVTSYIVEIRRESIYYFYTLIMPCGVLSSCSLLLFWLPPDSEEKITLGVTILLAFFVNSLVVSNYTPESASTLPVIGVYYTFNIFVVALSLTGSVFVLKLHFRGHVRDKVPEWVKNLFRIETDQLIKLSKIHNNIYNNPNVVARFLNQNTSLVYKLNEDKLPRTKSFSTTRQILKLLKEEFEKFQDHRRKEEEKMKLILEWKELARKLDRCFLCVLFVTITITPLILFGKFFIQDLDSDSNSLLSKNDCHCILDNY